MVGCRSLYWSGDRSGFQCKVQGIILFLVTIVEEVWMVFFIIDGVGQADRVLDGGCCLSSSPERWGA